jgi:short-subunit dehydrogenase
MPPLTGRVAIVTGASSGIGAAAARAFGRESMRVALFARRAGRLEQVAHEVRALGGRAIVVPGDVRDRASIDNLAARTLLEYGQIDVLFNNAGLGRLGWLEQIDPADVRLQIDVNLLGAIDAAQTVLPHMLRRRSGHIINMSSLAGLIASPAYSAYAATKFGLRGFTEALHREVAPWGVQVSGVYAAGVETEWGDRAGFRRRTGTRVARRLRMSAEHVAEAIVRLVKRPRRQVILPPIARLLVWIDRVAPWTADWVTRRFVLAERSDE